MPKCKITVLVENTAGGRELLAEHGLSFWIELPQGKVLFDAGQGFVLKHNAQRLGVRLESIENIVLSHGHYDHTGGLSHVLTLGKRPRVFVHPQAFEAKYARSADGVARNVGMSEVIKKDVRSMADLKWVEASTEIGGGLWLTGPIPRTNSYEDVGGAFFKDENCRISDDLLDDQAAFLETKKGIVVILGCAHAGVINTLHFIQTITADRPIYAVLGGMHLLNASAQRIEETIAELRRLDVKRLMPCHCTGFAAAARLWNELPGRCEAIPVGSVISFED
ncbi:MAG: MBL fold metallo-hydrolase [Candidatus Omnitrophica bacterium]|nr:MBL fold metallo-hydrolase [Candidatus Omnitrophota bacterium]